MDRGAYVRVLVPQCCVVTRAAIEKHLGRPFRFAQDATDKLQPVVETSARRLVLAKQVALAKWDSKASVEDTAREAQVIMGAAKDGEPKRLNQTFVSHFFAAQIEANKLVQYVLLADWIAWA